MHVGSMSFLDIPGWLQEQFADESCGVNNGNYSVKNYQSDYVLKNQQEDSQEMG